MQGRRLRIAFPSIRSRLCFLPYEAPVVERLNLIKNGNVDQRVLDILMERMLTERRRI
jgi:hypothetical protein